MARSKAFLNFYGVSVNIVGDTSVVNLLTKDFEFFIIPDDGKKDAQFSFELVLESPDYSSIEGRVASRQSFNSITYDIGRMRFNDYYGKALSLYNYSIDKGFVWSLDLGTLHEIAYLMILSRTAKKLDDQSLHKVHAMAIKYKSTALILMMPMKGGKSTLFIDLLKQKGIEIISDDTPLIGIDGNCYPFPLRVGVHDITRLPSGDESLIYSMDRLQYGKKQLIPMTFFDNKIATVSDKVILLDGYRIHGDECKIIVSNSFMAFRSLIKHMVVGVGLPIIIEYFLEYNLKDTLRNFKILIYRLSAAFNLARKAKFYKVLLGHDMDKNASTIYKHLKQINDDI